MSDSDNLFSQENLLVTNLEPDPPSLFDSEIASLNPTSQEGLFTEPLDNQVLLENSENNLIAQAIDSFDDSVVENGLVAQYFDNKNLTNLVAIRQDPTVNFNWGKETPITGVGDRFSVRWSGQLEAQYSETYTFYTQSDDGVRLWVNGELIIDDWKNHGVKERNGTIALEAGQLYDIKLEYFDNGGRAVAKLLWSSDSQSKEILPESSLYSSLPEPVEPGNGNGLTARYFKNKDFTGLEAIRTDSNIDFDWRRSAPVAGVGDRFSVRWSGQLEANYSENYTFYTQSDDGVRLWVNGELLIDDWKNHGVKERNGTIALEAGQLYDIKLEYFDNGGRAVAKLLWASDSQVKQIIPSSQFYSELPEPVSQGNGTGLIGEYFDKKNFTDLILTRTDSTVDFDWRKGKPAPGVDNDSFSVRWSGFVQPQFDEVYTFHTQADDGVRLWINGELIIKDWRNNGVRERSGSIALEAGQLYDIKLEYFENRGKATAKLLWSSDSQVKQIIPASQLFTFNARLASDTGVSGDGITFDPTITGAIKGNRGNSLLHGFLVGVGEEPIDLSDIIQADGSFTISAAQLAEINGGTLPDGSYTLKLIATQDDGQIFESLVDFTLDRTTPELSLLTPLEDGEHSSKARLIGEVTPGDILEYNLDGSAAILLEADELGKFDHSLAELESGNYNITIQARDIAGNINRDQFNFQVTADFEIGSSSTSGWGAKNSDTVILGEQDSLVAQTTRTIDLGLEIGESGEPEGTRTLQFDIETFWDDTDIALKEDQLLVYLVDPTNPSQTLLNNGTDGTAVFALAGEEAEFTPGLVSFDGTTVSIDLTSLQDLTEGLLVFQLLNQDGDDGTRIKIANLTNFTDVTGTSKISFNDSINLVEAGDALDLAALNSSETVDILLNNIRFNSEIGQYQAELRVRNTASPIDRNMAVVFLDLPANVELLEASGLDADGNPYISFTNAIYGGGLDKGAFSDAISITFANPNLTRFSLNPQVLSGGENLPPVFEPIPALSITPGAKLEVPLIAEDPNGDVVTYLLETDSSLPTGTLEGGGKLIFTPTPDEIGNYEFTIIATDGIAETRQTVTLEVVPDPVTTTRISGTLLDTDATALAGVSIELGEFTTVTDSEGNFTLEFPADLVPTEDFDLEVPTGDIFLDPLNTGKVTLDYQRTRFDDRTGTEESNPRRHPNLVSSFIDGSNIYGSDNTSANALRVNDGSGKLITSDGNLLPLDNNSFVAGDSRVNENVGIASLSTLFVREHNRLAEIIATDNPDFDGETIYQQARKLVIAQVQHITYSEYLPLLLGADIIPEYTGYSETVDPAVSALFTAVISSISQSQFVREIQRLDSDGNEIANGNLALNEAFFTSKPVIEDGIEPVLRGLINQLAELVDLKVIEQLRNFSGDAENTDLVAVEIQRSRDLGLPNYNQARIDFGLEPVFSFDEITSDLEVQQALEQLYGVVDNLDVWVGGLAEDHVGGAMIGELFQSVIADQYTRSRNSDRFWYENEQLTEAELNLVRSTTLGSLIERNSSITGIGDNVFTTGLAPIAPGEVGTAATNSTNEYASFDGAGNNLANPEYGAVGDNLRADFTFEYGDGISTVAGDNRPPARLISNEILSQSEDVPNSYDATAIGLFWEQFVAQDLSRTQAGISDTLKIHADGLAGDKAYPFIAEKLHLLLGRNVYQGVNNVIDRPIYLPALDIENAVTIDPDVDVTVTTENLPGASVFVAAGSLEDQDGNPFTGQLSITEVPADLTPAALPEGLFPDMVVTIQPGEMQFTTPAPLNLPNLAGYGAGEEMDLWSINPDTGDFDQVGKGKVSEDRTVIETIEGGIRNSSWHMFASVGIDPQDNDKNPEEGCNACENGDSMNSIVESHSGALVETHELVTYQSNGETRGVTLTYDSLRADPRPIVHFGLERFNPIFPNRRLSGRLEFKQQGLNYLVPGRIINIYSGFGSSRGGGNSPAVPQIPQIIYSFDSGEHFWDIPQGNTTANGAIQADLSHAPSGKYQYNLNVGNRFVVPSTFNNAIVAGVNGPTIEGDLIHVNSIKSPFGSGWGLSGWQQIIENDDGSILIIDGDGSELIFTVSEEDESDDRRESSSDSNSSGYINPPGDFSTISRSSTGTFRRTTKDQTVYTFNEQNQIASMVDANGNETRYVYDSNHNLIKIIDPVGLETVFSYNTAGKVSKITDPTNRETILEYDEAGNLIGVVDPDNSQRTWEYDSKHHMIAEVDQRGNREEAFYDFAGRVYQALRKDGSEVAVDPIQTQGLYPPSTTVDPLTPPRARESESEITRRYVDGNGNVNETVLDRAGQAVSSRDGEGELPSRDRNDDNLITSISDGRGNETEYEYDERGNLIRISDTFVSSQPSVALPYLFSNPLNHPRYDTVDNPDSLISIDINDDNYEELIVFGEDGFSLLQGQKIGIFDERIEYEALSNPINGLLTDLDNDGNLDLVLLNDDSSFSVWAGQDDGNLATRQDYSLETEARFFGDLNNDSVEDIVAFNDIENFSVWLATEENIFFAKTTYTPPDQVINYFFEDLNGDNFTDLLTVNNNATFSVWLNDGRGVFANTDYDLSENSLISFFDDFDGNGVKDLILFDQNSISALWLGNSDGTFNFSQNYRTLSTTVKTIFQDFNKDGNEDFLLVQDDNNFSVELVDNNNSVTLKNNYSSLSNITDGILSDFNVDGQQDLVLANEDKSVSLWPGTSDESFASRIDYLPKSELESFVATADFNNDGIEDVAVLNLLVSDIPEVENESAIISVEIGQTDGSFSEPIHYNIGEFVFSITTGDLNGDGNEDIIFSSATETEIVLPQSPPFLALVPKIYVLPGLGDGSFGESELAYEPSLDFGGPNNDFPPIINDFDLLEHLIPSDLDIDGDLDLIKIEQISGMIEIFFNNGAGSLEKLNTIEFPSPIESFSVSDLNLDGLIDLIITNYNDETLTPTVLFGANDGSFITPDKFSVLNSSATNLLVDLNNDGYQEVVSIRDDQNFSIWQAEDDDILAARKDYTSRSNWLNSSLSDLNEDGLLDSVLVNEDNTISVWLRQNDLSLGNRFDYLVPRDIVASYKADFNGDLLEDTIELNSDNSFSVRLNSEIDGVILPSNDYTTIANPESGSVEDFNNDGNLDFISFNESSSFSVWLGNGDGTFAERADYYTPRKNSELPELIGDLNNDGYQDILFPNNRFAYSIWLGDSDGAFTRGANFVDDQYSTAATVADLDNDGIVDLTIVGRNSRNERTLRFFAGNGNGTFADSVDVSVSYFYDLLFTEDLDHDGDLDLIAADKRSSGRVGILLNNNNGNFSTPNEQKVGELDEIRIDDLNQDGNFDLVVSSSSEFSVLIGDNGSFASPINYSIPSLSSNLIWSDINNDSITDLIAVDDDTGTNAYIFQGKADGTFTDSVYYRLANHVGEVDLIDINQDELPDFVTFNQSDDKLTILLNEGDADFTPVINQSLDLELVSIVPGDINQDSILDLVTFDEEQNTNSVYLGNNDGTLNKLFREEVATDSQAFTLKDLNEDGIEDLALVEEKSNDLSLFLSDANGDLNLISDLILTDSRSTQFIGDLNGDGIEDNVSIDGAMDKILVQLGTEDDAFPAAIEYFVGGNPQSLVVSDVDKDGALDLVVVNRDSDNLSLLWGIGDGTFEAQINYEVGKAPVDVKVTDYDLDGYLDLLVLNQDDENLTLLLGNRDTSFTDVSQFASSIKTYEYDDFNISLVSVDLNNDGILDLVRNDRGSLSVRLGNEDGGFDDQQNYNVDSRLRYFSLEDANNDQILDFIGVTSSYDNSKIYFLQGLGDGSFGNTQTYDLGNRYYPTFASLEDFDSDGSLDLVTGNFNTVSVFAGDGEGNFGNKTDYALSSNEDEFTIEDLDGDGINDLISTHGDSIFSNGHLEIRFGTGSGLFAEPVIYPVNTRRPGNLLVEDLNGDELLDLVTVDSSNSNISVLLNLGDGLFDASTEYKISGYFPRSVVSGDIDGDGILDLVTGNYYDRSFSLLLGQGDGSFDSSLNFAASGGIEDLALRDIDLDGDLDIIYSDFRRDISINFNSLNGGFSTVTGDQTYTYDPKFNKVTSAVDELGRTTFYDIDPENGNTLSTTQVVGRVGGLDDVTTSYTYTDAGLVDTMLDPLGRITNYDYDPFGRLISVTYAVGTVDEVVRRYEYDAAGNQTALIDENDNRTEFEYDAANRIKKIIEADPDGDGPLTNPITSFTYDKAGNLVETIDARESVTEFKYDELNRQIEIVDANDETTKFEYDAGGNLFKIVDAEGRETQNVYDSRDRLVSTFDAEGYETKFKYDADNNLVGIIDPLGHETKYVYDARSRLIREIDAEENVTTYNYDVANNLVSVKDDNDHETQFRYDDLNRQVALVNSLGDVFTTEYDKLGNIISTTDELGHSYNYSYDELNRVKKITNPLAGVVSYNYDSAGNLTTVTDELERSTNFTYDALHRNINIQDSLNNSASYNYDSIGNLTTVTDGNKNSTSYFYDALNRLEIVENALGDRITNDYDAVGNVLSITDELNLTTRFGYDRRNFQTSVTDPLGHTSSTEYDGVGNIVAFEDALGNRSTYGFDKIYRLISETDPEGRTISYSYDGVGNLLSITDPEENITSYIYDELDRLFEDTNHLGDTRRYQYDKVSNLVRSTDRNGREIVYDYDELNRNTAEIWLDENGSPIHRIDSDYNAASELTNISDIYSAYAYRYDLAGRLKEVDNLGTTGVPNVVFSYGYDAAHNLTSVTDAINEVISGVETFIYDELNRVKTITQSGNGVVDKRVDYSYDAASQRTGLRRYSDLTGTNLVAETSYDYDLAGRLTDLIHLQGADVLAAFAWDYDAANRITRFTSPDGVSDYNYDENNQLLDAIHSYQEDESYSYDKNGNRTNEGYVTEDNNRLQSDGVYEYEYDKEGNRTRRVEIATGEVTEYLWDHRNRLVAVVTKDISGNVIKNADYTYDVFDRRIAKSVDSNGDGAAEAVVERFVYNGEHIALVFDGEGNQTERFFHGVRIDEVISQENGDGEVLWALADHQNTVRVVLDNEGNVVNRLSYDSFGQITNETNPDVDFRFSYTGREFDEEAGQYFYRARYYDATIGRFVSEDPIGFAAGDGNLSRYVLNSPTNYVDPSGLKTARTVRPNRVNTYRNNTNNRGSGASSGPYNQLNRSQNPSGYPVDGNFTQYNNNPSSSWGIFWDKFWKKEHSWQNGQPVLPKPIVHPTCISAPGIPCEPEEPFDPGDISEKIKELLEQNKEESESNSCPAPTASSDNSSPQNSQNQNSQNQNSQNEDNNDIWGDVNDADLEEFGLDNDYKKASDWAENLAEHAWERQDVGQFIRNGIRTKQDLAERADGIKNNPTEVWKRPRDSVEAYWDDQTNLVIINNPQQPTAFIPETGKDYLPANDFIRE